MSRARPGRGADQCLVAGAFVAYAPATGLQQAHERHGKACAKGTCRAGARCFLQLIRPPGGHGAAGSPGSAMHASSLPGILLFGCSTLELAEDNLAERNGSRLFQLKNGLGILRVEPFERVFGAKVAAACGQCRRARAFSEGSRPSGGCRVLRGLPVCHRPAECSP